MTKPDMLPKTDRLRDPGGPAQAEPQVTEFVTTSSVQFERFYTGTTLNLVYRQPPYEDARSKATTTMLSSTGK